MSARVLAVGMIGAGRGSPTPDRPWREGGNLLPGLAPTPTLLSRPDCRLPGSPEQPWPSDLPTAAAVRRT